MTFPNKIYTVLKWIDLTAIPAIIVFLGVVLPIVGVSSETTQMVLTIAGAADVLLGSLIGVSSVQYANKQKEEEDNGNV